MALSGFLPEINLGVEGETKGGLHRGTQRVNPEFRVGFNFRIIPEQYFSGVENVAEFLENIDNNNPLSGLAVLCLRDHGFTLTNGVVSYALDRVCPNQLFQSLHYLNVGTICVTDPRSKDAFKDIQASWNSSSLFKRIPIMLLNPQDMGECPFCNQTQRHRWIAIQGMCAILHHPIHPIFHSCPV
ncbi:uncharacterized protein TNCV_4975681 [Trichonephila clavipes]|uniref:Uncharacterized protein n=1 Tax=Trichonephila clavipes TaxID=2585209 RepID=A0A8X6VLA4_TRICX|nr:uncharacterized protein TNCV_4975681 [Trichonephila clavipes]